MLKVGNFSGVASKASLINTLLCSWSKRGKDLGVYAAGTRITTYPLVAPLQLLRVGNLNAGGRYGVSDSLSVSTTASGKQVGNQSV